MARTRANAQNFASFAGNTAASFLPLSSREDDAIDNLGEGLGVIPIIRTGILGAKAAINVAKAAGDVALDLGDLITGERSGVAGGKVSMPFGAAQPEYNANLRQLPFSASSGHRQVAEGVQEFLPQLGAMFLLPNTVKIPKTFSLLARVITSCFSSRGALFASLAAGSFPVVYLRVLLTFLEWIEKQGVHTAFFESNERVIYHSMRNGNAPGFAINAIFSARATPSVVPLEIEALAEVTSDAINQNAGFKNAQETVWTNRANQLTKIVRDMDTRPVFKLSRDVPSTFIRALQSVEPGYRYVRYTMSQPHAECAHARSLLFQQMLTKAHNIGKGVNMVGGSIEQVAQVDRIFHNCSPRLSGRDTLRYEHHNNLLASQHHASVSCVDTMQKCKHMERGATLLLPLSAQDIGLDDVVIKMAEIGTTKAYAIVQVPLPFVRGDVNECIDDVLGVHYIRDGHRVHMSYMTCGSAGYTNDCEKTLSWLKSPSYLVGHHCLVEVIASVGSMYLLEIGVCAGKQEGYPLRVELPQARFYQLPYITPARLGRSFCVSAQKFEGIVKFAEIAGEEKCLFENIANKVRGMESEVKIGGRVIMEKWTLDLDSFNSVIAHAICAAAFLRDDVASFVHNQQSPVGLAKIRSCISIACRASFPFLFPARKAYYQPIDAFAYLREPREMGFMDSLKFNMIEDYSLKRNNGRIYEWLTSEQEEEIFADALEGRQMQNGEEAASAQNNEEERQDKGKGKEVVVQEEEREDDARVALSDADLGEIDEDEVGTTGVTSQLESETEWAPEVWHERFIDHLSRNEQQNAYQLDYSPAEITEVMHGGQIDFFGKYQQTPNGTPSDNLHFAAFPSMAHICEAESPICVTAPDSGLLALAETLIAKKYKPPIECKGRRRAIAEMVIPEKDGENDAIVDTLTRYQKRCGGQKDSALKGPVLYVDGIPGSAKSTLVRAIISKYKRTIVAVPTRVLAEDWRRRTDEKKVNVVTMHKIQSSGEILVIDECNRMDLHVFQSWLRMASEKAIPVIALGDRFQTDSKEGDCLSRMLRNSCNTIEMLNSFTMCGDALKAYCQINSLDTSRFRTLSQTMRSLLVTGAKVEGVELEIKARVMGDDAKGEYQDVLASVAQVQGLRAGIVQFHTTLPPRSYKWCNGRKAWKSVILSRHSVGLALDIPKEAAENMFGLSWRKANFINSNSIEMKKQIRLHFPGFNDYIPKIVVNRPNAVNHAAYPMSGSLGIEEKLVPFGPAREQEIIDPSFGVNKISGVVGVHQRTVELITELAKYGNRRDYKEDLSLDLAPAPGLLSVGEVAFGEEPAMRSTIEGVNCLGDLQLSRDRHYDLKNIVERQLTEPRSFQITQRDIADAREMLGLYKRTFCKQELITTTFRATNYDYLANRTEQFIRAWNDPFLESSDTLRHPAFLKTQLKAKWDLQGQETHGQTVIANHSSKTNYFAHQCRLVINAMRETDRDDFISDIGYSDKELGNLCRERGILSRIVENGNLQIDLSKQDSTHRPAHVIAFVLFAIENGCDPDVMWNYALGRSRAFVKSLAPHLYKAEIGDNLTSGDPFTLVANCFMMKCCLAVEYDGLENCAGMQKGDDFICSNEGWMKSTRERLRGNLRYNMKILVNKAPYHAGRFLTRDRLLADPVRAFLRHFAKTYDPGVSDHDLWVSYTDRCTDYTWAEREYLMQAVPDMYPGMSGEQLNTILDVVINLRYYRFFTSTYKSAGRKPGSIFSPQTDCAYRVAALLLPHLARSTLRHFRYASGSAVRDLFLRFGIRCLLVSSLVDVPRFYRGAVVYKDHCFAIL